ncbi:efflux RND transporter periplasmic adaptor subunit [Ferviditalea candida]|uniref:Efflux RND transporter periplasmic adaptor subunit n=1 Tax=Ferviditalea candida TaxID=3108399 RepID=A0ABU5ZKV7_9BACL|nr:efflux RND transporter periplasmic adaptor subunit [Paenibacillaceae bacterium T2]
MKKRKIMIAVLLLIVIIGGLGGGYYYIQESKYISTDDAKIDGDLRAIGSLAAGTLIQWNAQEGDSFRKGDVLGVVQTSANSTLDIIAPDDGTIVSTNAVKDQTVSPGAALAMTVDLNKLYVTANIQETDLNNVRVGNKVSISVDAFPGIVFTGRVDTIGLATNSELSLLPASNSSSNYTKIIQRVPVKIVLDNYQDERLIPGLNATVKISKS